MGVDFEVESLEKGAGKMIVRGGVGLGLSIAGLVVYGYTPAGWWTVWLVIGSVVTAAIGGANIGIAGALQTLRDEILKAKAKR